MPLTRLQNVHPNGGIQTIELPNAKIILLQEAPSAPTGLVLCNDGKNATLVWSRPSVSLIMVEGSDKKTDRTMRYEAVPLVDSQMTYSNP